MKIVVNSWSQCWSLRMNRQSIPRESRAPRTGANLIISGLVPATTIILGTSFTDLGLLLCLLWCEAFLLEF